MFCKHDWEKAGERLVQGGMNKEYAFRCKKCGKETVRLLESAFKFMRKHGIAE